MPPKAQAWFVYDEVERDQDFFRLCRLLPGREDAPIRCEIENARISDTTGTYSALSYTWGEAKEQRFIRLNGKPFTVSPNLLQALKAVRNRDTELLIWVDAICINQLEANERNHQVALMGDIFRNAKSVLAWIGPAADNSDAYFDYLENMGNPSETATERKDDAAKIAVVALNKRSYWRRAWIKQELNLAKDIIVYCGSRVCQKISFFWFASMLTIDEVDGYQDYISKIYFHRCRDQDGKHETLEELMDRYTHTECSEIRDRVFALYSMASDCRSMDRKLVDYDISLPALFFTLIAHFQPQNVLTFASILQDVLAIRKAELLKYWNTVIFDTKMQASTPREELAISYIRQIDHYGKSLAPSLPIGQVSDFIIRSFLAANAPDSLGQKDKVLKVEGTDLWLSFRHTLFGFHFKEVYKQTYDQETGAAKSLAEFDPPYTLETSWKLMVLPMLLLAAEQLLGPAYLARAKEGVVENHGLDAVNPDVDVICWILSELRRKKKFKRTRLCLVDCRYVFSTVYGHTLWRLREFGK